MVRVGDLRKRMVVRWMSAVVLLVAFPFVPLSADSVAPDPWVEARLRGSTAHTYRWEVRQLVTARSDRGVDVWNLDQRRHVVSLWRYIEPIQHLFLSGDEETLVAIARDGRVRRWDASSWAARSGLRATLPGPSNAALSFDGRLLAIGSTNGIVGLWDFRTRHERARFLAHSGGVEGLDLASDASCLLTCGADSLVKIWKLRSAPDGSLDRSHTPTLIIQTGERELFGAYFLDDRCVTTYGTSGCRYWDPATGAEKAPPDGLPGIRPVEN